MSSLALDDIEMCLDAAGLPWSRRDQGWAVPAAGDVTRELLVLPAEDGLTVDAVLIEWDEAELGASNRGTGGFGSSGR